MYNTVLTMQPYVEFYMCTVCLINEAQSKYLYFNSTNVLVAKRTCLNHFYVFKN